LPFSISIAEFTKQGQGRAEAEGEIRETFTRLVNALESKGLRVTARRGRGKLAENKEVWIFVRADQAKIGELWEKERAEDASIGGNATRGTKAGLTDADEIRLVHGLLVSAPEQGGIGITPGEGEWKRVKSIVAIHDEQVHLTRQTSPRRHSALMTVVLPRQTTSGYSLGWDATGPSVFASAKTTATRSATT
jgi:hypothetical protein